jgi:E3 ubiquitin-protein ligase MYCBP2
MTSASFPTSKRIRDLLEPVEKLYADISTRVLARIKVEGMEKDAKLVDPSSQFYGKPLEYGMATFAFYTCFKCSKAYFGGARNCAANADTESRPASEFICFDCSGVKAMIKCKDPAHAEYAVFKCRFCCRKPAVW